MCFSNREIGRQKNIIEVVGMFPYVYGLCWSCILTLRATNMKLVSFEIENVPKDIQKHYLKVSNIIRLIDQKFPGILVLD